MPIIQGKIIKSSTIHTDGWKAYDGLILNGYDHHRVFSFSPMSFPEKNHMLTALNPFGLFAKED